jgi:hypothetical protein
MVIKLGISYVGICLDMRLLFRSTRTCYDLAVLPLEDLPTPSTCVCAELAAASGCSDVEVKCRQCYCNTMLFNTHKVV